MLALLLPMKASTPTMPSLPTAATSTVAPSSIVETSETTAVVGKYTWRKLEPASNKVLQAGISTHSRWDSM
ncbi:hypothetical protein D9M68_729770 [compost metagenome]